MVTRLVGVAFRRAGEAARLPLCFAGEGFLVAADVVACRVDFAVALGLEVVEDGVEGLEGGYAGAAGCVGAGRVSVGWVEEEKCWDVADPIVMQPRMILGLPVPVMRGILMVALQVRFDQNRSGCLENSRMLQGVMKFNGL